MLDSVCNGFGVLPVNSVVIQTERTIGTLVQSLTDVVFLQSLMLRAQEEKRTITNNDVFVLKFYALVDKCLGKPRENKVLELPAYLTLSTTESSPVSAATRSLNSGLPPKLLDARLQPPNRLREYACMARQNVIVRQDCECLLKNSEAILLQRIHQRRYGVAC